MDDKLIGDIKTKLQKEKEEIISELSSVAKPDKGEHIPGSFDPQFPNYGDDSADEDIGEISATEVEEYSINVDVTGRLEQRLDDIEESLKRIDTNEYGLCEVCGKAIDTNRILANPAALTCVKCAKK